MSRRNPGGARKLSSGSLLVAGRPRFLGLERSFPMPQANSQLNTTPLELDLARVRRLALKCGQIETQ